MSIANIPENKMAFSGGNNIRIAIAGLAICKFAVPNSTIRFLRHVDKHKLKMNILQMRASDMEVLGSTDYTIGDASKTIAITGGDSTSSFEHRPSTYQEKELKELLDMQFLHGHPLTQRNTTPAYGRLTVMTINHCRFYTAELTEDEFDLVKNDVLVPIKKKFCKILGGYMKVNPAGANPKLTITIPHFFPSPIELPVKVGDEEYLYEIQFNNSCFEENNQPCAKDSNVPQDARTDFPKVYDVLEDKVRPIDKFDLIRLDSSGTKSPNTGACLPVVEEPCLNC